MPLIGAPIRNVLHTTESYGRHTNYRYTRKQNLQANSRSSYQFWHKRAGSTEVIRASCTYSFYPGGRIWAYFHSSGSSFRDTGRFSKLLYLSMKLGHWQKFQKLYIHVQPPSIREGGGGGGGVKIELTLAQRTAVSKTLGQKTQAQNCLFENETTTGKSSKSCSLFLPQDSKLSLILLYGSGYRDTDQF